MIEVFFHLSTLYTIQHTSSDWNQFGQKPKISKLWAKQVNIDQLFWKWAHRNTHGVPKGGQKEKKLSGFGAYIFGIGIPRGLILW